MEDYSKNAPDLTEYSFPHLDDTRFPSLENVDVYKYENEFDYSRWSDSTKIYLCNVLWNNDYKDVVKFENNEERDKYFNELTSYVIDLTTAFHVAPNGQVKVPVPYAVATRYNYMFVDLPIMTSEEEPINYESTRRTQRYYYFIDGIAQHSPNSTVLVVSPDNWTTYINNVNIPYIMLERGHAPMASIDVDTYLSNPLEYNEFLLAPDFDFSNDNDGVVASAKFVPINNGEKYIIFATTMSYGQVKTQSYPQILSNSTPATFANAEARDGWQYIVNDYQWNYGDFNYDGLYTETTTFQSSNNAIPNGMTMIACKAANARGMFAFMSDNIPFFYKTIKACLMVDDTMFTKGDSFAFCNTECFQVLPAEDSILYAIKLQKNDFGYHEKYAEITKLYTSPYAHIEVTDNNGDTRKFKIENTSNVEIRKATAIAFPYISIQAYITGVNGRGYNTYTWKRIDNDIVNKQMYSDDFGEYLWDMQIPTYALFVRGYDEYKAANYNQQFVDRYNAILEYQKTVGMDNTQYENSKDGANNTEQMTNNSAKTEYDNAIAMNATIQTNNVNSANTSKDNAYAAATTANTNANNTADNAVANTALDVARVAANNSTNLTAQYTQTHYGCLLNIANGKWDRALTSQNVDAENNFTSATGVANAVAGVVGGVGSVLQQGNPLAMIGAGMQAAANVTAAGITSVCTCTKNTTIANNSNSNNLGKLGEINQNNYDNYDILETNMNTQTAQNNTTATAMTANTAGMMRTNAGNTQTMEKANADRTNGTSIGNANRTKGTSDGNADRTKSNSNTNAALNKNLTIANSDYTRKRGVQNAQITLEQKRINAQYQYKTQRLSAPAQYGDYSGDMTLDAFERRGLQVKVRTQAHGNIAQTGDLMLRYGYAFNQVWDMEQATLTMMKHFTYWKASDIWINQGEGVNGDAQRDIQQAFENGVTIWSNPDEIGKVSIYDNWN